MIMEIVLFGMMIVLTMSIVARPLPNKEEKILPMGRDELASDEEILGALNAATLTVSFGVSTIRNAGGVALDWSLEWVKVFQNNPHHMEGWLYNHIILMLLVLQEYRFDLTDKGYAILERAIIWSDLGKYHTTKEGKKEWDNGTKISTAFGHDKKSAELYKEGGGVDDAVHWIVAEHMKAHSLEEMDANGKTTIPDFLKPAIEGLEAWNWPEWADLDIPHGESMSKKDYAWKQRGSSKLLRIKQICDSEGRISDLQF